MIRPIPMGNGPLDHPRLLAIEAQLDAGKLDDAQQFLADLGDPAELRHATTYLVTRLLYQRGKLSREEVAERLKDLLRAVDPFPRASAMLQAAEAGTLGPDYRYQPSTSPPREQPTAPPAAVSTTPPRWPPRQTWRPGQAQTEPSSTPPDALPDLEFPKPPGVPDVEGQSSKSTTTGDSHPQGVQPPEPRTSSKQTQPDMPALGDPSEVLDLVATEKPRGYYSSRPPEVEAVGSGSMAPRNSPSRPAPQSRRPSSSVRARPHVSLDETPTLFSVLGLLDDQRYDEALAMLERAAAVSSPEFVLMRARALLGLNRRDEAVLALRRLCEAPLLEPELRAGCARLLIGADEWALAYQQARAAYDIDAASPVVRLALAWAAVRVARREEESDRMRLAQQLLETIDVDHGPTPALALGLKACVELEQGQNERALRTAHRALDMDANCVDALAALALASARLGRGAEAEDAWRRMLRSSSEEAHAVRPLLDRIEAPIDRVRASLAPPSAEPASRRVWDPLEIALVNGEPAALRQHWEDRCQVELSRLSGSAETQLAWLAERSAQLLSQAPGWTHFAPYDFSLWSLLRLQVAIELVYGDREAQGDDAGSALVLGAYLGETVRLAHDGYWNGSIAEAEHASVVTDQGELAPFAGVRAHIATGSKLALDDYLDLGTAHRGQLPWSHYKHNPSEVVCPWAPVPRPEVQHLSAIGRAVGRSMLGLYCERYADAPLDCSVENLCALESYLALVSPPYSPVDAECPAFKRVAVLVGCYLGEVLRAVAGGEWVTSGPGASNYSFRSGDVSVSPVDHVMRRLQGQHALTLSAFVDDVARYG